MTDFMYPKDEWMNEKDKEKYLINKKHALEGQKQAEYVPVDVRRRKNILDFISP